MSTLFDFIDRNQPGMFSLLESLVNIDSDSYDKEGPDRVTGLMAERLAALGLTVEFHRQTERGDHMVARKPGRNGRNILLLGHSDTVFPRGTAAERPFRVEGDHAYGPGVADMKGGLVVLLYALAAIRAGAPETWAELGCTVVINSDEELSSPTSQGLIAVEAARSQAICVMECAREGGEYVTERKGVGTFCLRVIGKSAHAGVRPEAGANAINDLCRRLLAIQDLAEPARGMTVNTGVIRGGTRPNVVPDLAEAEIDVRFTRAEDAERITAAIRRIAEQPGAPGIRVELSGGVEFPPLERTEASLRLFGLVQAAGRELGLGLDHVTTGGASDGNCASQYAPVIDGMGPRGGRDHSPDEYIDLPSLAERAKVLARFITLWHGAAG